MRFFAGCFATWLLVVTHVAVGIAAAQETAPAPDGDGGIYVRLDDFLTPEGGDLRQPHANVDAYLEPAGSCCCGQEYWGWTILPQGIIYKSYLAGAKEARLGLNVIHVDDHVDESGWMWDGTLGGRVGLLRYGNRNPFHPQGFQIDVEAAAQVRLSFEDDNDVQATDYRVGVPLTYGWGCQQIKFGYWHLSSHLGDEFLLKNQGFDRLNYAKDSLVLGYSYYVRHDLRLYAEASWAFWSDVAEPWEFQFGVDWAPTCPTGIWGAPFFAANVHLREEVEFGGNFVAQTGWAWRSDVSGRLLRMGVHYYHGESSQYSFVDEFEKQIGVGIWYDF